VLHPGGHTLGGTAGPDEGAQEPLAAPALVLAFECHRPIAGPARLGLSDLHEVTLGRGAERALATEGGRAELLIPDRWMSGKHARLTSSFGRWILEDCGSKNGTRVNGKTIERIELQSGDVVEAGRSFFVFRADGPPSARGLEEFAGAAPYSVHPALERDLDKLTKIAATPVAILILGESGTGKEVLAELIHKHSGRSGQLVAVNCGALPAGLVESELFGHKKGAFSGAVQDHKGLVRQADGGTLFLDEVADLPGPSQAALLRVLQEREVRPVGDTAVVPVDIRTIAATHLDLEARVEAGAFRRDLFARIGSYRVTLPPLRDRIEDLGLLIARFSESLAVQRIELEAARALFGYRWPLNVRELQSALSTASVLSSEGTICLEHLPEPLRTLDQPGPEKQGLSEEDRALVDSLKSLLEEHRGNISAIARAMGKDRKQIQRWLKRFELDAESYRV
jgi:transcriptional regulator of acetoin/glycerol metabolism